MAQHVQYQDQSISVGDTIRVHQAIEEGKKTRTQVFEGIVIAIKNGGSGKSMTVRRMTGGGIGVERIIPLMLSSIKQIEVKRQGEVRRSKLYYLRERIGKAATKIREKNTFNKPA
jgi:large subunit ribosomal protein L19